jgi:hypothetical protein
MISLKKNDKIIIIVAVVILVIAGVGIAMYQSPKTSSSIPPSTTTGETSYNVIWTIRNGTLNTISEFAGKKSQYQTTIQIPVENLKSITFNLSWTDDHMTFMKRRGLDSLTLEVTTPDGVTFTDTNTSAPKTGYGMITQTVSTGIIPPVSSIKANDENSAQAILKGKTYYDDSWTNKNININVSVKIGEIRILKQMRDKGNNFDLKISYQYYDGTLNEGTTKNTGGNSNTPPEDPWAKQVNPPYISMIINTGCGRYV